MMSCDCIRWHRMETEIERDKVIIYGRKRGSKGG